MARSIITASADCPRFAGAGFPYRQALSGASQGHPIHNPHPSLIDPQPSLLEFCSIDKFDAQFLGVADIFSLCCIVYLQRRLFDGNFSNYKLLLTLVLSGHPFHGSLKTRSILIALRFRFRPPPLFHFNDVFSLDKIDVDFNRLLEIASC